MTMQKVTRGAPIAVAASDYNLIVAAVDDYLSRAAAKTTRQKSAVAARVRRELAYNGTGMTLDRYKVLGIAPTQIGTVFDEDQFKNAIVYYGSVPDSTKHLGRFAITLEPIKSGAIGLVTTTGAVQVLVHDNSQAGVRRADIVHGKTGYLQLTGCGSAKVLYRPGGPGQQWSIVKLSCDDDVFPVLMECDGGEQSETYVTEEGVVVVTAATWTYTVRDYGGKTLLAGVSPIALPHHCTRQPYGVIGIANYGMARYNAGVLELIACNETWQPEFPYQEIYDLQQNILLIEENINNLAESLESLGDMYDALEERVHALEEKCP